MHNNLKDPARRRSALAALLLASCIGTPIALSAGVNAWTQIGPDGGSLGRLLAAPSDPSILYACGATLFRSTDGGTTWQAGGGAVGSGCPLAVDVIDPQRLYGIDSGEFLRSLDGGEIWNPSGFGLPQLDSPLAVEQDLHDASLLILVSAGKIFRSRYRAESWEEIPGPVGATVGAVHIEPTLPGSLWLLSDEDAIYRSADRGDSWTALNSNLPAAAGLLQLSFDANVPGLAYLGTTAGTFRSRDGGAHWSQIPAPGFITVGGDSKLYTMEGFPYFVPSVSRSEDFGDTWQRLPSSPFRFVPLVGGVGLYASRNALFGFGSLDLMRSLDDGDSWQESTAGLHASRLWALALDRQNPDALYAVVSEADRAERVASSADRGATWQRRVVAVPEGRPYISALAVDPSDSRHLVATTSYARMSSLNGLLTSTDRGLTWTFRPMSGICLAGADLTIDPLNPSRLLVAGDFSPPPCVSSCPNQISDDGGETWRCSELPDPDDRLRGMVPSPFAEDLILAMGYTGIYRSIDAGVTWNRVAEEPTIPGSPPGFALFNDIAWATAEKAYASNERGGLYVSQDAGQTWTPLAAPEDLAYPWLGEIAVDRFHPQELYALAKPAVLAPAFTEVVRSRDGGSTWESLSAGLAGWQLSDLVVDPVTSNRLYVSAAGGGILAYDVQEPAPCVPSATALCITDGRFRLESLWRDFSGRSGVGHAVPLASDTGAFWFFDPDNLELFAKEIDGVSYNNAFWTFYGALSNVEFTLLATDTATGAQHGYFNRSTQFASRGDIESFPQEVAFASSSPARSAPVLRPARSVAPRSPNACVPDATTLCLQEGRFAASVTWRDFAGRTGVGTPIVLTPDTGSFWFFDAGIHELAVKVIDGRGTNNAYWVFYGSLSNVEFDLTVIDTTTGEIWTRENPSGTFASDGDIEAFPQ